MNGSSIARPILACVLMVAMALPASAARCPADLNGDDAVDVFDLLDLLAAWGPCADCDACAADVNGDCTVDVFDLLDLLAAWGPCAEPSRPVIVYSNVGDDETPPMFMMTPSSDAPSAIIADDLWLVSPGSVIEITFTIALTLNAPSMLESVDLDLLFWEIDSTEPKPPTPEPGNEIAVINVVLADVNLEPNNWAFITISDDDGFFDAPERVWAGIRLNSATFEDEGSLHQIGQVLFDPPAIGESSDFFWLQNVGVSFLGVPVNFGWEIVAKGE